MKRAVAAAVSSAAGFAAVLGAHLASGTSHGLAAGLKKAPPAGNGPSSGSAARAGGSGGSTGTTTTSAPSNSPTTSAAAGQVASAVGSSEQYGYGVLSVKVTVEGRRITDVSVASLQTAESYSQSIAQQVIPVLRQEVLQAQGVQVNGISGATYTCEAYVLSVQSALTKLNL